MSEAIRFLHAFAQVMSTMALYSPGHPAAERALDIAWQALQALIARQEHPIFLFLGGAPVYDGRAMHELAQWPWSKRLSEAGIQRLEFDTDLGRAGFVLLLDRMLVRLNSGAPEPGSVEEDPITGVRYGTVTVMESTSADDSASEVEEEAAVVPIEPSREMSLELGDELDATGFIFSEAAAGRVARTEADTVARILGVQLDHHDLPQAIHSGKHDTYPQFHAVNTALLAMAAAQAAGVDRVGRHRIGVAALLHDIGMATLPREVALGESLTTEQRALMETHTVAGARLLLSTSGPGLELAATVAFEHHLRPDRTGYPVRRHPLTSHWVSRVVGVAAAYVALRSPRPFRPAWSPSRVLGYLGEGAGEVFDSEAAKLIASLVRPA